MLRKWLIALALGFSPTTQVFASCADDGAASKTVAMSLSQWYAKTRTLNGIDVATQQQVSLKYCAGAPIHARSGIGDLRKGDVLYLKTVTSAGVTRVASIDVNVWTGIVRVGRKHGSDSTITVLNDQTLVPITRAYPPYLGAAPTHAYLLPGATHLPEGKVVKIFGYKAPESKTIAVFRVEPLTVANRQR